MARTEKKKTPSVSIFTFSSSSFFLSFYHQSCSVEKGQQAEEHQGGISPKMGKGTGKKAQ
ncbi:hypothetical protein TRV_06714 [Trichophyton verrucosum HKI 0517]|uniref:Uncharacterized protein n=1 Tax=Trichophyton verrucosum (strain HKI 0517) TaxID=663202 RepID=D4DHQ7_TRIVH|nr:uncharacterized protein TRV_06714 [Trichophyton verrucosum HKI 0517]EFE38606.1 hypothetical protein TRV_06714 [Trichophyton verrucosum HKI 0517]